MSSGPIARLALLLAFLACTVLAGWPGRPVRAAELVVAQGVDAESLDPHRSCAITWAGSTSSSIVVNTSGARAVERRVLRTRIDVVRSEAVLAVWAGKLVSAAGK